MARGGIRIDRVYTRGGDAGDTSLVGGQRVAKDHHRIEAYGTVDELNSWIGMCRQAAADAGIGGLPDQLLRVQHALFNAGSCLATMPEDLGPNQPRIHDADTAWLEEQIDACNTDLPALTSFVLPGGSHLNASLHVARTVCRRAERLVTGLGRSGGGGRTELAYLNRLSDALFVWSRWVIQQRGEAEVLWSPDQA